MPASKKKRRPVHRHTMWGVTFDGEYDTSLRLSCTERCAWGLAAFKLNMIPKDSVDAYFEGWREVPKQIKTKLKKRGAGVCRVRVTRQQVD